VPHFLLRLPYCPATDAIESFSFDTVEEYCSVTTTTLASTAVIRVSRGTFDPARFEEVERMTRETGKYLIPAIRQLPGLIEYFAAASPTGSIVHISIWDTDEHAQQMSRLKEMIVNARNDAEAVGVTFVPIVNYPVNWAV
jgi:hypothetical protein